MTAATTDHREEHQPDRQPDDRDEVGLRSRIGDSMAAANRSGGRKTRRTSSGWSVIFGSPGTKPEGQPAEHEQARPGQLQAPRSSNRSAIATVIAMIAPRASMGGVWRPNSPIGP